ncbi:MAG: hypothetical protein IJY05_00600 [Clostridia bacterium]|nr:hypothetical protein [Clostridia bacterium]
MRNYLLTFFKEFEYEETDRHQLLCAYDTICNNTAANELLTGALAAYDENFALDYQEKS